MCGPKGGEIKLRCVNCAVVIDDGEGCRDGDVIGLGFGQGLGLGRAGQVEPARRNRTSIRRCAMGRNTTNIRVESRPRKGRHSVCLLHP